MDSLDMPANTSGPQTRQWADKSPLVEDIVHHRWELDRVLIALKNLPEPHQTIFTHHYFQHMPLKDVAERVGRPIGTVKVYLHRARKMVLSHLENKTTTKNVTS